MTPGSARLLKCGATSRTYSGMSANHGIHWMWDEACARLDEAERRHRRFFELLAAPGGTPAWEPPANVFANGSELYVAVALPGARADAISVEITAHGLVVETRVEPPCMRLDLNVLRLEIPYGRMRRNIELPPGRYLLVERHLDEGCLYLRLKGFAT
jgi:HSP20 family molecular chaperone IbpA